MTLKILFCTNIFLTFYEINVKNSRFCFGIMYEISYTRYIKVIYLFIFRYLRVEHFYYPFDKLSEYLGLQNFVTLIKILTSCRRSILQIIAAND